MDWSKIQFKKLCVRTWWFKNLLAEICHFITPKYKSQVIPANFFWVICVRFLSCHYRNFRTFATIFHRFPNIAENVGRCSGNLIEHILVVRVVIKLNTAFWNIFGNIKFNFVINHVWKNKLSGFVTQAWKIVLDACNQCLVLKRVLKHKMNYDMNLIQSWLSANKLTLNVKKTKYML